PKWVESCPGSTHFGRALLPARGGSPGDDRRGRECGAGAIRAAPLARQAPTYLRFRPVMNSVRASVSRREEPAIQFLWCLRGVTRHGENAQLRVGPDHPGLVVGVVVARPQAGAR